MRIGVSDEANASLMDLVALIDAVTLLVTSMTSLVDEPGTLGVRRAYTRDVPAQEVWT